MLETERKMMILNEVLQLQGYLVFISRDEYPVGYVFDDIRAGGESIAAAKAVVCGPASELEFLEQCESIRSLGPEITWDLPEPNPPDSKYHRVILE